MTISRHPSRPLLLPLAIAVTAALFAVAPAASASTPPPPLGTLCVVVPSQPAPVITSTPYVDRCVPWPSSSD